MSVIKNSKGDDYRIHCPLIPLSFLKSTLQNPLSFIAIFLALPHVSKASFLLEILAYLRASFRYVAQRCSILRAVS